MNRVHAFAPGGLRGGKPGREVLHLPAPERLDPRLIAELRKQVMRNPDEFRRDVGRELFRVLLREDHERVMDDAPPQRRIRLTCKCLQRIEL